MSKTDDFYRLAALRAAEGFSAKKPVKTKDQRYYASHKEQCKAKAKAYRAANNEKVATWLPFLLRCINGPPKYQSSLKSGFLGG